MTTQYHVPDQPRCEKLKQLGFPREWYHLYWHKDEYGKWHMSCVWESRAFKAKDIIAAPTTDEMVEWLSKQYDNHMKIRPLIAISPSGKYECELWRWDGKILYGNTVGADTLANAVCDAVLWVLEKAREK